MRWQSKFMAGVVAAAVSLFGTPLLSQQDNGSGARGRYLAPPDQVVAILAGRLFDSVAGNMMNNQVVLIRGDRITEVGANVQIPAGSRVIDLSSVTVMPGMIDAHTHVNSGGAANQAVTPARRAFVALASAQTDMLAGFTTVADMDSRGGYNTVDLRDAINRGIVMGPRMQVVSQSLNPRSADYYADTQSLRFLDGTVENKNINSPWLARAAVRESKLRGVDWIKIYTTQDFIGPMREFRPDGTLVATPSMTPEEVDAIVDEAHRMGLKVACHTYSKEGMMSCLNAGVDAPNHLLELTDEGVSVLLAQNLPFVVTLDDLIAQEEEDLEETDGKNSRLRLAEQAFKKAIAAGISIVFGSGATSATIPHGPQADQFKYYQEWGLTAVETLQTAYMNAARMLNYDWYNEIGSIEEELIRKTE